MATVITREVSPGDWQALTGWREHVFPTEGLGKQWYPVSHHIVSYNDRQAPVAHLGFDLFDLTLGEQPYRVIGIGGVVVVPTFQGQGLPAQLFEILHRRAPKMLEADCFALFCPERLVAYYQRHGYTQHRDPVVFLQEGEPVPSQFAWLHRGLPAQGRVRIPSPPW